jgi:type IV pilus assembly protein PilA
MIQTRAGVLGGRHIARGVTLVELMIVVAIMSVLATLAVYGVRRYIESAKSHEATNMIKDIKEGQESYRRETHRYLPVSSSLTSYYPDRPTAGPWDSKIQWGAIDDDDVAAWNVLNVRPDGPVYFSYACIVGTAADDPTNPWTDVNPSKNQAWPATNEDWYVVKAVADLDDNGKKSGFVGSSFTSEIWHENEGE